MKKCVDCGKKIGIQAQRCKACAGLKRRKQKSKCIDCGKEVSRKESLRCYKCAYIGKLNHAYIDGRTKRKKNRKCKKCNASITSGSKLGYCANCASKLSVKIINKHHIDLDRENENNENLLYLSLQEHSKLHRQSYTFLVEKGLIKDYIEWFKNKFNPKIFNKKEYVESRNL